MRTNSSEYYIFPGRFQPLHNDHIKTIKLILEKVPPNEVLIIGIICNSVTSVNPFSEFEDLALKNNNLERNPFSSLERLKIINTCLANELIDLRNRIYAILLPRPESNWSLIETLLDGRRTWFVPDSKDDFDEWKVRFFKLKDDEVIRVPLSGEIKSTIIRSQIKNETETWTKLIPSSTISLIKNDTDE